MRTCSFAGVLLNTFPGQFTRWGGHNLGRKGTKLMQLSQTNQLVFFTAEFPSNIPGTPPVCATAFQTAPRNSRMEKTSPFTKLLWVMQSLTSTSHLPRSSAKSAWELGHLHSGTEQTPEASEISAGLLLLPSTHSSVMRLQLAFADREPSVWWAHGKQSTNLRDSNSLDDFIPSFNWYSCPRQLGGEPVVAAWKSALQAV